MAENKIKTIGVLTSGGDAPGMNAAIRAVVRRGLSSGLNVKGIYKGYSGLLNEEIRDMTARDVSDTIDSSRLQRSAESMGSTALLLSVETDPSQVLRSLRTLESIPLACRELLTLISHVPSTPSVSILL